MIKKCLEILIYASLPLTFLFLGRGVGSAESPEEVIKRYDVGSYHPQLHGLKDLVVDIRMNELVNQLNDKLIFGKLDDVYFRFYWLSSGKSDIEIFGMPKGFNEIKADLVALVQNRIDFIIPKFLEPELKGYKLSIEGKTGGNLHIKALDPDHAKFIQEIHLIFDKADRLVKMTTIGPIGSETATFAGSKKSWGQNKWVLDEIGVNSSQGIQSTALVNKITYDKFEGIGLPVRVESNTKQTLLQPMTNKDDVYKREVNNVVTFSDYKVNTGEASSFFKKKR